MHQKLPPLATHAESSIIYFYLFKIKSGGQELYYALLSLDQGIHIQQKETTILHIWLDIQTFA